MPSRRIMKGFWVLLPCNEWLCLGRTYMRLRLVLWENIQDTSKKILPAALRVSFSTGARTDIKTNAVTDHRASPFQLWTVVKLKRNETTSTISCSILNQIIEEVKVQCFTWREYQSWDVCFCVSNSGMIVCCWVGIVRRRVLKYLTPLTVCRQGLRSLWQGARRPPPIRIIVIKPHRLIPLLYPSVRVIWRHNIGVLDQKSLGIGSLSVYSSNLQGGALIT